MTTTNKKTTNFFIILSILLLIISCILGVKLMQTNKELGSEITEKAAVISEKDKMLIQLENLQIEYDELSTEYTGLGELFNDEKKKVESLLKEIKMHKGSVNAYQKQVNLLKEQLREYLSRIEILEDRNQELNEENLMVKSSLDSARNVNTELSSENENLSAKVEVGSVLKAYEFFADGIRLKSNGQEIPTQRAKRVDKIRTCFLLGENAITEAGNKTIYLRIADPDGKILIKGNKEECLFNFEGQDIAYSIKQQIKYDNKSMDLCFYWDKDIELQKGVYYVDIFIENYRLGSTSFTLQ
ncbi:MAG: hypothetical protein K9J13_08050 [Saprospiraceae bacterium]|nr:hypothetical protein [Saprospiraceae bacterium]